MNVAGRPLNGEKTHPLSEHALRALASLQVGPLPRSALNPGVLNRLFREELIEEFDHPSPFRTRKGMIPHVRITAAGRARLEAPAGASK